MQRKSKGGFLDCSGSRPLMTTVVKSLEVTRSIWNDSLELMVIARWPQRPLHMRAPASFSTSPSTVSPICEATFDYRATMLKWLPQPLSDIDQHKYNVGAKRMMSLGTKNCSQENLDEWKHLKLFLYLQCWGLTQGLTHTLDKCCTTKLHPSQRIWKFSAERKF